MRGLVRTFLLVMLLVGSTALLHAPAFAAIAMQPSAHTVGTTVTNPVAGLQQHPEQISQLASSKSTDNSQIECSDTEDEDEDEDILSLRKIPANDHYLTSLTLHSGRRLSKQCIKKQLHAYVQHKSAATERYIMFRVFRI